MLQVFAGSLPARSAPALHCSFSVAEFRTDRPKSGKFAGQSEISDLPPISVSRREPAASCRGNASASVRYRGQRRRIDIPILLLIRPELEPQTIHHFDSGVSLFWTDFDSLNNACAATASGNNPRSSPMTLKTIATLLILSTLATGGANSASAQDSASAQGRDFRSGAFGGEGGGSFDRRGLSGYGGFGGGYGYGNDNGYSDWYGISSGHNECPLFRQRVMTRDGWRVRMAPIC